MAGAQRENNRRKAKQGQKVEREEEMEKEEEDEEGRRKGKTIKRTNDRKTRAGKWLSIHRR